MTVSSAGASCVLRLPRDGPGGGGKESADAPKASRAAWADGLVPMLCERIGELLLGHFRSSWDSFLLGALVEIVAAEPVQLIVSVRVSVGVGFGRHVPARADVVKSPL